MISEQQISELVNKIVSEYSPEKIVLFGSYAEGNADVDSDLDLLVIKESILSRTGRIVDLKSRLLKYKIMFPIDLLVYTNKELKDENFGKFSFIANVLRTGRVLYER